ncbi:hypothetical protein F6X40_24065 [Paraburkholderia sp. UCT31]|uniref:DNA-binding protein n=1 Tax=Paraburkholderia sp. UCT31 TaxID=2615209 RepID=UPI001655A370|nr:DNA-binding protein [Paraburkholderia sp. UCT31]MBC8739793.1 hypothetical protein [Paraburkholderia sp. UCT31]
MTASTAETVAQTMEEALERDILALKEEHRDTQPLYRAVAALLFFKYGQPPTANHMYTLVRRGSMSAPAQALKAFWSELRDKSRVRLERADLPEPLTTLLGSFGAQIWELALAQADVSLESFRAEAQSAVDTATAALAGAEREISTLQHVMENKNRTMLAKDERIEALSAELSGERARAALADQQLAEARAEHETMRREAQQAREEARSLLEAAQRDHQAALERLTANERRALLEVDSQRQAASKATKELGTVRQELQLARERAAQEVQELQQQNSSLSRQVGALEGALRELRAQTKRPLQEPSRATPVSRRLRAAR